MSILELFCYSGTIQIAAMNELAWGQIPVADAAAVLDVHPSRVRAMIADGQLEAEKVGGRWFVDRKSVENRRSQSWVNGRPFSEAMDGLSFVWVRGRSPIGSVDGNSLDFADVCVRTDSKSWRRA